MAAYIRLTSHRRPTWSPFLIYHSYTHSGFARPISRGLVTPPPITRHHGSPAIMTSSDDKPPPSSQPAEPLTEPDPPRPKPESSSGYLSLPPAAGNEKVTTTTKLDVGAEGGAVAKLDHLGPMVVNQDGTMSRIANWGEMAEIEKRNTLRVLGKRNRERLDALRAQEEITPRTASEAEN